MKTGSRDHSSVDARGFVYALTPYLRKQEWQLERLENRLAVANRVLVVALEKRSALDENFEFQMKSLRSCMHPQPNPHAYQRGLLYLAHLRSEMKRQDQEIEVLRSQKEVVRAQCIGQQLRLDGLMDHRAIELQGYADNMARLSAAEADRDWIGRSFVRHAELGESV